MIENIKNTNADFYERLRVQRRDDILNISKKLFLEKGIRNTTIKDIANALELSRQTVYKYYNNINDIVIDVEIMVLTEIMQALQFDLNYTNALEAIDYTILEFFKLLETNNENVIFTILFDSHFRSITEYNPSDNPYTQLIQGVDVFIPIIESGKIQGNIRKDVDPLSAQVLILNLLMGLLQRISLRGEFFAIEQNTDIDMIRDEFRTMVKRYLQA